MLRIETTPRFNRHLAAFVKAHPDLRVQTRELIDRLARNPFNPKNKTHSLSGPLKGLLGSSINWYYRIVFVLSAHSIVFINIGSHDEVY